MAGSAVLLAFADGLEQDAHRVRRLASHDEGPGQTDASRHDGRVPRREIAALLGQHPPVPQHGLVGMPGRQVRGGQPDATTRASAWPGTSLASQRAARSRQ